MRREERFDFEGEVAERGTRHIDDHGVESTSEVERRQIGVVDRRSVVVSDTEVFAKQVVRINRCLWDLAGGDDLTIDKQIYRSSELSGWCEGVAKRVMTFR